MTTSTADKAPAASLPLQTAVHKALRRMMFDTLAAIGTLDVTDAADLARAFNGLQRLLAVLQEPAPALRALAQAMTDGPASERAAAAAALYRELAALVTARLQRMQREAEDDEEAAGSPHPRARLSSLDVEELCEALQWMARALTPQELAALLDDVQQSASGQHFRAVLETVSAELDGRRWDQLARALRIPQLVVPAVERRRGGVAA